VDALDALPSMLKVSALDTWKAVLREGLGCKQNRKSVGLVDFVENRQQFSTQAAA
jgi:hypothetical protein